MIKLFLLTVKEKRDGEIRSDPHAILTLLGWVACGEVSPLPNAVAKVHRVQTCPDCSVDVKSPLLKTDPEIMLRDNRIRELEQALKDVT